MTNEQMIANMIMRAKSKLGIPEYAGWCLAFIEDALEQSNDIEIFGDGTNRQSSEIPGWVPLERELAQKPD